MRIKITVSVFLVFTPLAFAQTLPVHVEVSSVVDTADPDIAQVIQLWENYLNSKPDSSYLNPYWSESEQRQYNPYDLVPHTWWSMSLYAWLPHCRTSVLSVSRIGESFIIRTMFYRSLPRDSGKVSVITIFQTGARRENGSYKLCNALPINTRHWQKEQVGSIRFVFRPEHRFNRVLAVRMSAFVDSLAGVWQLSLVPTEYYFAEDIDPVAKALGFDYWPAEGNESGPEGFTDSNNRIIYAGGANEWYPHEFVHIYINPLFPNAHHYFLEGYATLVGGSGGHNLAWHLERNSEYLEMHPDVDALTFKGADLNTPAQYFIGGLLCKMAEEKGGLQAIRKLMTYGSTDDELYRAIRDTFGVNKQDVNSFLRKKMAEYATE